MCKQLGVTFLKKGVIKYTKNNNNFVNPQQKVDTNFYKVRQCFQKKCNFNYGNTKKKSAESFVKDIRNNTRRIFTAEQKILIVMEALRAEISKAELCRKHSVNQSQFYKWNK